MVKELVMDNMYNTDLLSDRTKGADKFAMDSNEFQNIFADKNNTVFNENGISFNNRPNRLFETNTGAEIRFKNNKVSTNSTTQAPATTPNRTSADRYGIANRNNKLSSQDMGSDGYSFSIRDSLNTDKAGAQVKNPDVPSEATVQDSADMAAVNVKDTETVKKDVIDENPKDDLEQNTADTTDGQDDSSDVPVDEGQSDDGDEDTKTVETALKQNMSTDLNYNSLDNTQIASNKQTEIKIDDNADAPLNSDVESVISAGDDIKTTDTALNGIKISDTNQQPALLSETEVQNASEVEILTEEPAVNLDGELLAVENTSDAEFETAADDTLLQTDNSVLTEEADNKTAITEDNGWQILDETEQYEYTGDIAQDETTSQPFDNVTAETETTDTDNLTQTDTINVTEDMADTNDTVKVVTISDEDMAETSDTTTALKSNVDTDITEGRTELKTDKTDKADKDTVNTQTKELAQDAQSEEPAVNSSQVTADENNENTQTVTKDQRVSTKETPAVSKNDISADEVSINETSDNTQKVKQDSEERAEADLKTITTDEQSDVDVDLELNTKQNIQDNSTVNDESADTVSVAETEASADAETSSDNKNLAEQNNTKEQDKFANNTSSQNDDIDLTIQERTRLAYVDMTDADASSEEDIIAQLESKFDNTYEAVEPESVQPDDLVNNTDVDIEVQDDTKLRATSLEDVVDENMADDLNITLKGSTSSVDVYSTNSTAEQLIRYSIEGETGFESRLASTIRQSVQQQTANVANTSSKEILAQINEKLTTFNFRPGAKLTMQLSPENLGTVEIKLTNTLDGIRAEMTATSDDAGDMLNKHIDELKDTLQKYGVRLDRVSVSTNPSQQSDMQQDYTEQGNSQRQQQEQRQQQKEERGAQKFEDMVSSFFKEGSKE